MMSLTQQGSQTAIKRVANIPVAAVIVITDCIFISRYDDDAHVLIKICPACGNFVRGRKYAIKIPNNAAGLTMYHSSMNPRWRLCPSCSVVAACASSAEVVSETVSLQYVAGTSMQ